MLSDKKQDTQTSINKGTNGEHTIVINLDKQSQDPNNSQGLPFKQVNIINLNNNFTNNIINNYSSSTSTQRNSPRMNNADDPGSAENRKTDKRNHKKSLADHINDNVYSDNHEIVEPSPVVVADQT